MEGTCEVETDFLLVSTQAFVLGATPAKANSWRFQRILDADSGRSSSFPYASRFSNRKFDICGSILQEKM